MKLLTIGAPWWTNFKAVYDKFVSNTGSSIDLTYSKETLLPTNYNNMNESSEDLWHETGIRMEIYEKRF